MAPTSLSEQIAAAARAMEGEHDPSTTMDKAVALGLALVPGAQQACISLVHGDRSIDTQAPSSEAVRRLDALQYEHGEGPCLDAIRESEVVWSGDVRTDSRWPVWGTAASDETGVRSMLCFRLFTHDDNYGALNFYSRQRDAFDDEDREHGLAIAAHAAIAVAAAREIDQLKAGMDSRNVIGQAQGILMERFAIDGALAFTALARVSSQTNRKLRDIAAEVIRTRQLPETEGRRD